MEMERINDNTIRVIIGKEDLQDRGVTFLDLMGNQDEIENFFYSILEEVDEEERFQDSDTITFQVLPSRDGIELYISRNLAIDEGEIPTFDLPDDLKGEDYRDFIRQKILAMTKENQIEDGKQGLGKDAFLFSFNNFEEIIQLAKEVKGLYGQTNLYQLDQTYYLELYYPNDHFTTYEKKIDRALILEYGKESKKSSGLLMEHGKKLMSEAALDEIKQYF